MFFNDITGYGKIKEKLINTVKENRISHAQLFLGPEGCGKLAMAIAYAQYICCEQKKDDDSCGVCPSCVKYKKLIHPDLHFVYPVVKTKKFVKPVSDDFVAEWREFVLKSPFHNLISWLDFIGAENSQGGIFAQESQQIIHKLNMKTFESEYKVMIIWMPEKMNISAANKLLKMIEEPPEKTLFILVAENDEEIITTIKSRTQLVKIPRITYENMAVILKKEYPAIPDTEISNVAKLSDGNYIHAIKVLKSRNNIESDAEKIEAQNQNFQFFSQLMRFGYQANILEIMSLVDKIAAMGREKQKIFLEYCLRMVRENLVMNLTQNSNENINYLADDELAFSKKFSPFIHEKNIFLLTEEFNRTHYHIERNAYGKLVLLDMALNVVKYLRISKN